jgi:endoglucanase
MDEIFPEASANASGTNFTEIKVLVNNKSAFPARMGDKLSFRYYFTLEPGVTPQMITLTANFNQCTAPTGPTLASGSTFFVTISCVGVKIYPGGQSNFRKEIQFRIASAGAWDPSNDWSFAGVSTTPGSTPVKVTHIPVYDNGVRVFGLEPGGGDTQPPSTPQNLRVTGTTSSTVALAWDPSTDNVGVTGYQVFRGSTLAGTSATTTFTDTGLAASTTFSYSVRAFDAAGNVSAASSTLSARCASLGTGTTGTLSGVVYNAADKLLSNVVVSLRLANGTVKSAKTNNTGVWKLSSLPVGTYTLTATLNGYPTASFTMSVVEDQTLLAITTLGT